MPINIDFTPHQGHVEQADAYLTFAPAPPLSHWIHHFWQLNVPHGQYRYRSMPDNCVDLIININHPQDIFMITPFSSSMVFDLNGPVAYFGIRFRVLGHAGLIAAPLSEWHKDETLHVSNLLPPHILPAIYQHIGKPLTFKSRCKKFSEILLGTMHTPKIDTRLAHYIRYCHANLSSHIRLTDKQCSDFGLSARQLRRLSQLYLGLSPRELSRVFHFQYILQTLNTANDNSTNDNSTNNNPTWAEHYTEHYHDQSHFIHEFKKHSGLTPSQFKQLSVLYNKN